MVDAVSRRMGPQPSGRCELLDGVELGLEAPLGENVENKVEGPSSPDHVQGGLGVGRPAMGCAARPLELRRVGCGTLPGEPIRWGSAPERWAWRVLSIRAGPTARG